MKQKAQPYKLTFYVNDKEVDIAVKIDQSGRIVFQKVCLHICKSIIGKLPLWYPILPMSQTNSIRISHQIKQ